MTVGSKTHFLTPNLSSIEHWNLEEEIRRERNILEFDDR